VLIFERKLVLSARNMYAKALLNLSLPVIPHLIFEVLRS